MSNASRADALNDDQQSVDKQLLANLKAKVAWAFLSALEKARFGTLTLILPDGSREIFGLASPDLAAIVEPWPLTPHPNQFGRS